MADRVIRDELLESEKWVTLKDNADRLAYIALILKADDYGNSPADPHRMMRLWRDFGIVTAALASKTLIELADHDLIRMYEVAGKPYLHLPRFRNSRRYWSRKYPKSPFDEQQHIESNQQVTENLSADLRQTSPHTSGGVGVGVGVGVGRTTKSTTLSGKPDVSTLNGFKSQAKEVLEFLNAKTGRSYKAVPANLEMIAARLKDGATVEELRMVIAKKTREWGGDEKMNQYLRPATLFNRVKYAQYSGELLADPKPLRVAI